MQKKRWVINRCGKHYAAAAVGRNVRAAACLLFFALLAGCAGEGHGIPEEELLAGIPFYSVQKRGRNGGKSEKESLADKAAGRQDEGAGDEEEAYPRFAVPDGAGWIDAVMVSEGIYCIYNGSAYGYMTESGEMLAPFVYEEASGFHEGLACVSRDGKYGYLGADGEVAIPFCYDRAAPFMEGLAYFAAGDRYGFMDHDGEAVFYLDCESVSSFQEGLARFCAGGRYGYIDQTGKTVIEPAFDDAGYFTDGLAEAVIDGRHGMIDRTGAWVVAPEYESVMLEEGYIIACVEDVFDCFDAQGNPVFTEPCEYVSVDNGYLTFYREGGWGLADRSGVLLEPVYDSLSVVQGRGLVIAEREDGYGVTGLDGQEKLPCSYSWIWYEAGAGDGAFVVCDRDKFGCVDAGDFQERIPAVYDSIGTFYDGRAAAGIDGAYGLIRYEDGAGQDWRPLYDRLQLFEDGTMLGVKGSVYLICDRSGWPTGAGVCDGIRRRGECYQVERGGMSGFLDVRGRTVKAPVYDYVTDYEVWGSEEVYVTTCRGTENWDGLVVTGGDEGDITELLLRDEITPGAGICYRWMKEYDMNRAEDDTGEPAGLNGFLRTYRLYDPDHTGTPYLCYYASPYERSNFPMSYSGLYIPDGDGMVELVTGCECGGSMRGDCVCFYVDTRTGRILPGTGGTWGGFGGYSSTWDVYAYDADLREAVPVCSFCRISQYSGNHTDGELLAAAELFYDGDGRPYTAETILDAESVTEYYVNDTQVTREEYEQMRDRYRMISIPQ